MNLKKITKNIIICTLLVLILFNFMISVKPINFAKATSSDETTQTDDDSEADDDEDSEATGEDEESESFIESAESLLGSAIDGIVGILTWFPRVQVTALAGGFQLLTYFIASSAGVNGERTSVFVTPFDIFFNKFTLTNINVFSFDDVEEGSLVYDIRVNLSRFYMIIYGFALIILIIKAAYIGCNYLLSFIRNPESKAGDNERLISYFVSAALTVFMAGILLATIMINDGLIKIVEKIADGSELGSVMDALLASCFSPSFLLGTSATVVFVLMTIQTILFLIMYLKRFFVMIGLVLVAPIISSLYTGTAKSKNVLSNWFNKVISNVFIQSMHCMLYVVLVGTALSRFAETTEIGFSNLATGVFAVLAMFAVGKAEEWLRDLFGLNGAVSSINSMSKTAINTAASVGLYAAGAVATSQGVPVGGSLMSAGMAFGQNINSQEKSGNLSNAAGGLLGNLGSKIHYSQDKSGQGIAGALTNGGLGSGSSEVSPFEDGKDGALNLLSDEASTGEETLLSDDEEGDSELSGAQTKGIKEGLDKVENAINSTKHEEEENTKKKTENIEEEETETKVEDDKKKDEEEEQEEEEAIPQNLEEFKQMYTNLMQEMQEIKNNDEQIKQKLDDLKNEIGDEDALSIKNNIDKLDLEDAKNYADSLEGKQREFANAYIDSMKKQSLDENDEKLVSLVSNAISSGLIDKSQEGNLIAGGSVGKKALEGLSEENVMNSNALSQGINGNAEFRASTQENARLLQAINGEVSIEGEMSTEEMKDFNVKILDNVKENKYSKSNFKAAEEKVRREGDVAVKRLERFKANPNADNASRLTEGGKEYARLMVEAKQANMTVKTMKSTIQESSVTNESSNVITDLSGRRGTQNVTNINNYRNTGRRNRA